MTDITTLDNLTNAQLAEAYDSVRSQEEEVASTKKVLAEEILTRLKGDGEVMGAFTVSRVKKYSLDIPTKEKKDALVKLKDFGIVKTVEQLDATLVKTMALKGVVFPYPIKVTEYPNVKALSQE